MAYSQESVSEAFKLVMEVGSKRAAKKLKVSEKTIARLISYAMKKNKTKKQEVIAGDEIRMLIIGDLHAPFDLDSYFDHCVAVHEKYKCNKVIFIGDVIDSHYSSYHETDPDGLGGGQELRIAIRRLERWYRRFPDADVIIGNHDRLVSRKAVTAGIPSAWIRGYSDVLNAPRWNFTEQVVYDDVQYIHGEGGTARTKSKKDLMSTVQGHLHTQAYTEWAVGARFKIFGMQVGCGIDHSAYAFSYAKAFPKCAIGCGVVIGGKVAVNEMMNL